MGKRTFAWMIAVLALGALTPCTALAAYIATGNFRPIGDAPNIAWTPSPINKYVGSIIPVLPDNGPNALVDISDSNGLSLVNLPAQIVASGSFISTLYYGVATTWNISLIYEGAAPLLVNGKSIIAGDLLFALNCDDRFGSTILGGNCAGIYGGSSVLAPPPFEINYFQDYGTLQVSPPATSHFNPQGYPFVDAGAGQISGTFGAIFVPEPNSWLLMICGFGLVGSVLRTRRRRAPRPLGRTRPVHSR